MRCARTWAVLVAVVVLWAPAAQASTVNLFTSFWAFGDSLTDNGNLFSRTGGAEPPSPPYFEGRYSNDRVWAEHVADDFAARGLATGNFAHGQANTAPRPGRPIGPPFVLDLPDQIARFDEQAPGRLGFRPVASLWFGANDLFFTGIPGVDGAAPEGVGADSANRVADAALALAARGVNDVVLFNLPSLDRTPAYALRDDPLARDRALAGTLAFNATLAGRIPGLEGEGLNVITLDMFSLFNDLIDNPTDYGVANAIFPCFVRPTATTPAIGPCDNPELLAFFDPVHPNSVIHREIANLVRTEVAPIPLPAPAALLLAALVGLGMLRLRQVA